MLGLLLWRVPLGEIGAHLRLFHAITLLEVLGLSLGCWGIAAARLWCLIPEYRFRELLWLTFIARFYATVLPGQIAGDVVKAYRLGRQSKQVGHAEAATALDRALGLFALFLISATAIVYAPQLPLALRLFFVLGTVCLAAGGVLAGSGLFAKGILEPILARRQGRVGSFLREFSVALHDYLRKPLALLAATTIAIVFHAGCILMQVLLGDALGLRLPWADWTVVYAGVSLLMLLPISVAGLGLREGGYVGLLALFGFKAGAALSLSFAMLGASLVAALVGGGLELMKLLHHPVTKQRPTTRRPAGRS